MMKAHTKKIYMSIANLFLSRVARKDQEEKNGE